MRFKNTSIHGIYVHRRPGHIFLPVGGEIESENILVHPHITEVKEELPERARDDEGQFAPDDSSTPDVNEAWEGGKAPVKKTIKKKFSTKKPVE